MIYSFIELPQKIQCLATSATNFIVIMRVWLLYFHKVGLIHILKYILILFLQTNNLFNFPQYLYFKKIYFVILDMTACFPQFDVVAPILESVYMEYSVGRI